MATFSYVPPEGLGKGHQVFKGKECSSLMSRSDRNWHTVEQTDVISIDDVRAIYIHVRDKRRGRAFVVSVNVSDIVSFYIGDSGDETCELEVSTLITESEVCIIGLRFDLKCREDRIYCDHIEGTGPYGLDAIMPETYPNPLNVKWLLADYRGYRLMLQMDDTTVQAGYSAACLTQSNMEHMNAGQRKGDHMQYYSYISNLDVRLKVTVVI